MQRFIQQPTRPFHISLNNIKEKKTKCVIIDLKKGIAL